MVLLFAQDNPIPLNSSNSNRIGSRRYQLIRSQVIDLVLPDNPNSKGEAGNNSSKFLHYHPQLLKCQAQATLREGKAKAAESSDTTNPPRRQGPLEVAIQEALKETIYSNRFTRQIIQIRMRHSSPNNNNNNKMCRLAVVQLNRVHPE